MILLPGAVLPAELAHGALLEALGDELEGAAKELEIYAGEEPPPDYALDVEIEGILRAVEAVGFDRFHLVGYSGGGAASLAFPAEHRSGCGASRCSTPVGRERRPRGVRGVPSLRAAAPGGVRAARCIASEHMGPGMGRSLRPLDEGD